MTSTAAPVTIPDSPLPAFRRLMCSGGARNPFPLYAELREHSPVLRSPLPRALGGYVLSRYAECSAALRNRALVPPGMKHIGGLIPDWENRLSTRYLYRCLLFQDRPRHLQVRRRLSGHFTRTQVNGLRGFMESAARRCLDDLACREAEGETVDLVESLTLAYPLLVIGTLFGLEDPIPVELGWSGRALSGFVEPMQTPQQRERIDRAARELTEFFSSTVEYRRNRPSHDLVSTLVAAMRDGELDEPELVGNLLFLFTAGYDSSTSLLGNAVRALLEHPAQAAMVRDDPAVASSAVEELLRYDPPVHATSRLAVEPVRIADVEIPEGSLVWILLASANHDPALCERPDQLDLTRKSPSNLAFAAGPHSCIGAPLARMEAEVLLPLLLRRFPRMRLAGPPRQRRPGAVLRGPDHLPVVLGV